MLKEFKAFVLRGNVIDLAVGVVIGAAFGAIVASLVKDVVTPLLSIIHLPDFSNAYVHVGSKPGQGFVRYGMFVNAIISFVVISAVIFFFVVKPLNRLFGHDDDEEKPANRECPFCLSSIPAAATVCASCTREVPQAPAA